MIWLILWKNPFLNISPACIKKFSSQKFRQDFKSDHPALFTDVTQPDVDSNGYPVRLSFPLKRESMFFQRFLLPQE